MVHNDPYCEDLSCSANGNPEHWVTEKRTPVDPELFRRTAPKWNCVDYPGEGMHYLSSKGDCRWCGMSNTEIADERSRQEAQQAK